MWIFDLKNIHLFFSDMYISMNDVYDRGVFEILFCIDLNICTRTKNMKIINKYNIIPIFIDKSKIYKYRV